MNSQKYKIQALIAEIDEVLSKPVPRLPWTGSIDLVHQRQILERVRTYLVSPDSKLMAGHKQANSPKIPPPPVPVPKVPVGTTNQQSATQQILQAVTGEISYLRESLTGPLEADIQALREEQQALVQEIKLLEVRRQQQQSLAQQQANQQQIISDFLQAMTSRLSETLVADFSLSPRNLQNQSLGSASNSLDLNQQIPIEQRLLTPAERLEQMQQFETGADRLLMRLDSTMNIVFEALQGNLETYQGSLSQGLERMHGLGQQSEMMFTALVNHLAEELGREASSYVQQPTIDLSNQNATSTSQMLPNTAQIQLTGETLMAEGAIADRSNEGLREQERFPYAGTELSPQFGQLKRDRTSTAISLPDLAENLFNAVPQSDRPTTAFPGAQSEPESAESDEDVEDVYANLFLEEEVAELDLEDFVIENTATEIELVQSETQPVSSRSRPSINTQDLFASLLGEEDLPPQEPAGNANAQSSADTEDLFSNLVDDDDLFPEELTISDRDESSIDTEDLFSNLVDDESQFPEEPAISETDAPLNAGFELSPNTLDEDDSVADFLVDENSDFVNSNSVENLTLDTPNPLREEEVVTVRLFPETTVSRTIAQTNLDRSHVAPGDVYIQASPDENLLPVEQENEEDVDRSLNLDNDILEQLESDLYSLEGLPNISPRRSQPSATLNSGFLISTSDGDAKNPFAELAEEELGTLEDLFPDMLELSSEDEMAEIFTLEEKLDVELLAQEEDENVSLDDILASLIEADQASAQISQQTNKLRSNSPESQKKN
ncbi:hypothetical protein [Tychonema sp. BBK16]|uniref:hypothetical protein n=1 Tax=Tychonema sp. BBK16 TaxID=2699888 RepID=UPI001F1665AA|nr:hypothetical protein [Tychonema sp. BBK16]MCF6373890.1 hypothetical protein [Tychonema sp. BBK16]